MNYRWKTAASCVFGLSLLAACGGPQSRVTKGQVQTTIDQSADMGGYFEAIGIGAADPAIPTDTQRKALSRDAAIVKAQYEMLSMVKGVQLTGGITVARSIETNSDLETHIKQVIAGAEIVKSEFTADNGCVVTLRLKKSRLEELMGAKFK
jgi:hypothetical protein